MVNIKRCTILDLAAVNYVMNHPDIRRTALYDRAEDAAISAYGLLSKPPPINVLSDHDHTTIAVMEPFNSITWMVHEYILPKVRGRQAVRIVKAMAQWAWENTNAQKLIGITPAIDRRAVMFAQMVGFKIEGRLHRACKYEPTGDICDMYVLGMHKE